MVRLVSGGADSTTGRGDRSQPDRPLPQIAFVTSSPEEGSPATASSAATVLAKDTPAIPLFWPGGQLS